MAQALRRPAEVKGLFSLPNLLTASRPGLGLLGALALSSEDPELALWLYYAGLITDVADGMLARASNSSSDFGREFDRWADVAFNVTTGTALGIYAAAHRSLARLGALAAMVAVTTLSRSGKRRVRVTPHSAIAKYLSGVTRVVIFSLLVSEVPPPRRRLAILAGTSLLLVGGIYEWRVTRGEVRAGLRTEFPLPFSAGPTA